MMDGRVAVLLLAILSLSEADSPRCSVNGVEIEATDDKGVLTSPGFESGKALDNVRCLWIFKGSEDKFVEFTITDVRLKENFLCMYEFVQLEYDDSVEPYLRYCGQAKPETVILPIKSEPRVLFSSDGLDDGKQRGFRLEYRLVDKQQECGADYFACKRPFKCIPSEKQCDGKADCDNGEDESKCGHKAVQPTECGVPKIPPNMDRIIGGQPAFPGSWPWQVSVQSNYIWPSGHGCGGALLNNLYVLTAAHCVVGRLFKSFRVKFGEHNQFQDGGEEFTRDLEMYYMHPDYNRLTSKDDLAILKLSAPVDFSETVSPICLPKSKEELAPETLGYVTGWGTTEKSDASDELREVSVPVLAPEKCEDMVSRQLPPRTICTIVEEGEKNPCFGDSGGPFMRKQDGRWVLHGIVSWGSLVCGSAEEASVYTKVSEHIDWINSKINEPQITSD